MQNRRKTISALRLIGVALLVQSCGQSSFITYCSGDIYQTPKFFVDSEKGKMLLTEEEERRKNELD